MKVSLRQLQKSGVQTLETLANRLVSDGENTKEQDIIIGHADCLEDAQRLAAMIREQELVKNIIICDIGPVIGTHVGAGMLALVFMGRRNFDKE